MRNPVNLEDVVEAIEPLADEWRALIHRETGEIVAFSEEEAMMAEEEGSDLPAWFADSAVKIRDALYSDAYLELPGKLDFHEYQVMERFAWSLPEQQGDPLLQALRGRGAFRRFKDTVADLGLDTQWFACRDEALRQLAIDFLEDEGIPFSHGSKTPAS